MSFSLDGIDIVLKNLSDLSGQMGEQIDLELEASANTVLANAEDLAPVGPEVGQTHMRDTGHVDTGEHSATVTFDAEYSLFVEMGHLSRAGNPVQPQHFLLPPFYDEANALQSRLEELTSS